MAEEYKLRYELGEAGWADVIIKSGKISHKSSVSYLHDSLKDLAQMAIDLKNGLKMSQALFMGEPGELLLVVRVENDIAFCEARWFHDWASWGILQDTDYKVVVSGNCNVSDLVQQITNILKDIFENVGPTKYKKLWIEHKFPVKLYKSLVE